MHKNCLWLLKSQLKPEIYWIFVASELGFSIEKRSNTTSKMKKPFALLKYLKQPKSIKRNRLH